ncbi:Pycsar system effector family protein [Micromonospora sp. WMMD975]|uniref:Pycsar system effector family protein n=1 Tax=Micromonospora sp. WMMD975 TaxID=3016087 RepID=UPI002499B155|nr:Pycsar system effector family protein [Micromonospora sp. WMMD975]WFE30977.1 DUF5706 domain-containing protein [Micromonospora sp. WMMD975]
MREAQRSVLQQANDMIRFADVKAAAVLAAAGVLAGQLPSDQRSWTNGVLLVSGVCIALSALLALYTLAPRRAAAAWSLHYFDHVARRYGGDREAFIDAWVEQAADGDAFEREIIGQIWAANIVAHRKFTQITWSIRILVVGVVALVTVAVT